jgi:hypothetical protein
MSSIQVFLGLVVLVPHLVDCSLLVFSGGGPGSSWLLRHGICYGFGVPQIIPTWLHSILGHHSNLLYVQPARHVLRLLTSLAVISGLQHSVPSFWSPESFWSHRYTPFHSCTAPRTPLQTSSPSGWGFHFNKSRSESSGRLESHPDVVVFAYTPDLFA